MTNPRIGLSSSELHILDEQVLPTARRWLRQCPNLAHHAVATLRAWGEELVDDHGRPFVPEEERRRLALEEDRRLQEARGDAA
jgi:hypothetical protein